MLTAGQVCLHLRIQVRSELRAQFLAFIREATPFYEQPGGIVIRLLQDSSDECRFVELVQYADEAAYARDQLRVQNDPEMIARLAQWRSYLACPATVETYRIVAY